MEHEKDSICSLLRPTEPRSPGFVPQADLGVSCGNPTDWVPIHSGATVVDLGCGAGRDAFLAAYLVGSDGLVIGVDQDTEMLRRARSHADENNIQNTQFVHGLIEEVVGMDGLVDFVISNCVFALLEDKRAAFHSVWRLLRTDGWFAISDVLADRVVQGLDLGCNAVATDKQEYLNLIRSSGFVEVEVVAERAIPFGGATVVGMTIHGRKPAGQQHG